MQQHSIERKISDMEILTFLSARKMFRELEVSFSVAKKIRQQGIRLPDW